MKRGAQAQWNGTLKEGKGTLTTDSGALKQVRYAFVNRFENEPGTNPEELVAAAHAGCFSMAFSGQLAGAGFTPETIHTACTITFEKQEAGWTLLESHLDVRAKVPGAPKAAVEEKAEAAKKGCPISRALNVKVSMTLHVE